MFMDALAPVARDSVQRRPSKFKFTGIGGGASVKWTYVFPIGLFGNNGVLLSAEVENDIPLLISREYQKTLGLNIFSDGTVKIASLDISRRPIVFVTDPTA